MARPHPLPRAEAAAIPTHLLDRLEQPADYLPGFAAASRWHDPRIGAVTIPCVSTDRAVVWFSLAALVLAALVLAGLVDTLLLVVGYAALAALFLAHARASGVARPPLRSLVFHLVAILAVGAHLAMAIGYAIFAVVAAGHASETHRALLAPITAVVWLAIFALGVALWLRRRWLIAGLPVLAFAALILLRTYADALPAVPPPEAHRPALVEVIAELEYFGQGNRMARLTLDSGGTVTVHADRDERDHPGARGPQAGDLLLLGRDSGGRWFYALPGSGECFTLVDYGPGDLFDREAPIRFSFGLELPKADEYDRSSLGSAVQATPVRFCVNRDGEVASAKR
jgi:hypothetical protein